MIAFTRKNRDWRGAGPGWLGRRLLNSPDRPDRPDRSDPMMIVWLMIAAIAVFCIFASSAPAEERVVDFPPAESKPAPPMKTPPRYESSGEDTDILDYMGPTMRKSQKRAPPPPRTLTVIYKLVYGEKLKYVYEDGVEHVFEEWKSYQDDAYRLITMTNQRLADGMNYETATKPLASQGFDPVDIPLLYMAGDYDFALTEQEVANLRKFILDGGTILFNAARGRDEFTRSVAREMRKVFPTKAFMRLPADHPILNTRYRLTQALTLANGVQTSQPPEVYSIDIGTRAAAILVPLGMGAAWCGAPYHEAGKHIVGESAVRLGVNIVAYVLGNTEYGRFLAQEFPLYSGHTRPGDVFRFALLRYNGSWDLYPALQNSVLQGLSGKTGIGVNYEPVIVDLADPHIGDYPMVLMTGHYDFELTEQEISNLRNYLKRGGMLLASAAAGLKPFGVAFRREMAKVFPDNGLIKLPPTHALFAKGWIRIDQVEYTPTALRDDPLLAFPEFWGAFVDGRLAVLFTPYDLMTGVNREPNPYAKGLTPEDALNVTVDAITYSLSH